MDIAAMSIQMHASELQQAVALSVVKKTMEVQETAAAAMLQTLEACIPPATFGLGEIMDLRA